AVAGLIRELKPDVLITHSPFEAPGSTHEACSRITHMARAAAAGAIDDGLAPHRGGELFYVWTPADTTLWDHVTPRFPAIMIDITDVADRKLAALRRIKSQYYDGRFA